MAYTKMSISLPPELMEEIDLRSAGERSGVIATGLARYYYALADERRKLRELLTRDEIGLILDLCNGSMFSEPFSLRALAHEISDGLALESAGKKWKVDGEKLLVKIRGMSFVQLAALVDAVERWWIRVGNGENDLSPLAALEN